jgi:hypothetical protein
MKGRLDASHVLKSINRTKPTVAIAGHSESALSLNQLKKGYLIMEQTTWRHSPAPRSDSRLFYTNGRNISRVDRSHFKV